ncbi:hypothetical protein [Streptomonospora litoralis]|uniref:Uncharacterized protein n=1 Tax=Streptomonospora litoralis TaxID=2498135 RepID=A0A4V0ZKA9_9ACTN|nr:hypothetical protein [Streptomonospora litoralis]QBI56342.1 hypothetical protein EKD16_22945 [Streptomonospora litoralis]
MPTGTLGALALASEAAYRLPPAAMALAAEEFEERGNQLLGYASALGVLVGVLALIIIGGRMIHSNFTGDPWLAARGMAELPWVLLGIVLLVASGGLISTLLQGSVHETEQSVAEIIEDAEEQQEEEEFNALGDGCLEIPQEHRLSDDGGEQYVCPDEDDRWSRYFDVLPVTGPEDPRCTQGEEADCYRFCAAEEENCQWVEGEPWVWRDYFCPLEWTHTGEGFTPPKPNDCPDLLPADTNGIPAEHDDDPIWARRAWHCEYYPEYVEYDRPKPDLYCDLDEEWSP